ncbi:MAG: hypothetical protein A2W23_01965 [Planctomycetes bacterium RBG_16_43_13]|nr:MAG: hypothetical protein A2W23_01965 [Planctomycetes bacterium RBG_16_43_13]
MNHWDKESLLVARLSTVPPYIIPDADNIEWGRVLEIARSEETAGILYKNIRLLQIKVPADVLAGLEKIHLSVVSRNILQAGQLREVLKSLADKEISSIPLKGSVLSRFIYPELGLRDMADIDVLIKKDTLRETDAALRSLGYNSHDFITYHSTLTTYHSFYRNSVSYFKESDTTPSVLHLHWHIVNASVPLFMYSIDVEKIWEEVEEVDFGDGVKAFAMPPHFLLLHLSEHTLKHSFSTLIHLADISQLIRFYDGSSANSYKGAFPSTDWDAVFRYAVEWNVEFPLYLSLFYSHKIIGTMLPDDVLRRCRNKVSGFGGCYLVRSIERNNRWNGLSVFGYLVMCKNISKKVQFIRSMLFPPTDEMDKLGSRRDLSGYLRRMYRMIALSCSVLLGR